MITKTLQVGDYIFSARGLLARITKINKKTYSYVVINRGYGDNTPFNGIRNSYYLDEEWFECDDSKVKAFELAIKQYTTDIEVDKKLKELKELIGKAKFFLKQIEDVEEKELIEVR